MKEDIIRPLPLFGRTKKTTQHSSTYEPGSVVAVNYQYTSGIGSKRRPAIVMSCSAYHASKADAVVIPLTTQTIQDYFGDYDLLDWAAAGLLQKSRAKGVIETIERRLIERVIGKLSHRDLDGIKTSIRRIMEL